MVAVSLKKKKSKKYKKNKKKTKKKAVTEPSSIRKKSFSVGDTVVVGKSKSQVVSKLGQPDIKRVFNGRELWEYQDVQFAADNPETLNIYLTFEGDIVASSAGN